MSTVRVTCLLCEHPVEVPDVDVVLHVDAARPTTPRRYGFSCPDCGVFIVRNANRAIMQALLPLDIDLATGPVAPWDEPDGPGIVLVDAGRTPEQDPGEQVTAGTRGVGDRLAVAPPLTEGDLLLFRAALDDDAILAAWLTD